MTEKETFPITDGECDALNAIRGLHQDSFHLVVGATRRVNGGYILEGSEKAFGHLTRDVFEEIYNQLSPARHLKHLKKLYRRLEPESDKY